jgi:5'-nucleotidase
LSTQHPRRSLRAAVATVGLGLVVSPLALLAPTAHAADTVEINLLDINDFHGRIDANTIGFAGTVEKLRAELGEETTAFVSAGDNIGASLFASAVQDDEPMIEVLNALDMKASAVGNHEFDKGFDWLKSTVIDGEKPEEYTKADFPHLGANVYEKGTQTPVLEEYTLFEVSGLDVAMIGAVTEETPSLVSPGGIADLDFGDPVEAVNRVAAQLSDGVEDNGEADVIIAAYHEGAGAGTPDGATLEQEIAAGGAFADIVTKTHAEVDAIFTGHTHKQYAWKADKPGDTGTRPIVQTGSYGEYVGHIQLRVDVGTGEVTDVVAQNVKRLAPTDTDGDGRIGAAEQKAFDDQLIGAYQRVAAVKPILDDAFAVANEVGREPVGEVSADITTAYTGGDYVDGKYVGPDPTNPSAGRDDRASESALGNAIADALRDTLATPLRGGAQIGVVNPGGMRNELFYAGTPDPDTNKDGVVTYAEANAVLPFVNNLWTVRMTGAEFKEVLEQQWQTNADGTIPSRPFLHLGLSDNVSTTLDPSKPMGQRVTSVRVDGKPLELDREYVIGTFSFLAQGGDNFRAFTKGISKDSGLIDREGWIEYLRNNKPVSPSFDRRQVFTEDLPQRIRPGKEHLFTLDKLDLTSLGSPENTKVTASLKPAGGTGSGTELAEFPVVNGSADVKLALTGYMPAGRVIELVAQPSGTKVTVPVLPAKAQPKMRVVVKPDVLRAKQTHPRVRVVLRTPGVATVNGKVEVRTGGKVKTVRLVEGKKVVSFRPYAKHGPKKVTVRYLGSNKVLRTKQTIQVRVRR